MMQRTRFFASVLFIVGVVFLGGCFHAPRAGEPQPPQAQFSLSPITPKVGDEVVFDASASKDADGQIIEYLWDFGDGSPEESGQTVIHVYSAVGRYTVTLTVTDDQGLSNSVEKAVSVSEQSEPKKSLALSGVNPAALTWGDGAFWVADAQDPKVYKIDPSNGTPLLTIDLEQFDHPIIILGGIAWDAGRLWLVDGGEVKIYQIDPKTQKILRALPAPGPQPTGITSDGSALWISDAETRKIYKINSLTGKKVDEFNAPGEYPQGLAWDGQYLWLEDFAEQKIYKLGSQGEPLAEIEAPSSDPAGIAWDGQSLWVADGAEKKLFQLDISGL